MSVSSTPLEPGHGPIQSRRDFLFLTTGITAAVGVAATIYPLIDQMNPDAETLARGGPADIDISALQPGQQMIAVWQSHPVFITRRTPEAIAELKNPNLLAILSDPESLTTQQPDYARNETRSVNPEFGVLVGVCTHLGCIPHFEPTPNPDTPAPNWPGGYFCPCHGSKYDLAGRVYRGVPAPYNLAIPPYRFVNDKLLRIGENPPGSTFDFGSVLQL